jgi:hypothetical protein
MKHCHRPMVPSELPILVLFCGRAGTHLIDMTNGRSVREYRERLHDDRHLHDHRDLSTQFNRINFRLGSAWHGGWCWKRVAELLAAKHHTVCAHADRPVPTVSPAQTRHQPRHSYPRHRERNKVERFARRNSCRPLLCRNGGFRRRGENGEIDCRVGDGRCIFPRRRPKLFRPRFMEISHPQGPRRRPHSAATADGGDVGVNEQDRAWVDAKCTPQPIRCFMQPVALSGAHERIEESVYPCK